MATKKVQRYGILVILIVMVVGTIGSFVAMAFQGDSDRADSAYAQELYDAYMKEYEAYQKKVDAQGDELSKQYYDAFKQYESQASSFNQENVKELTTQDLVIGDGEEITGTTKFAAYYVGWNPKGKIFDQSIDTTAQKLKAPLSVASGLDSASLIAGWKDGMKGMKIGGVREITIPSDKAYGEQGQGDDIPPNTPLKFIVMAIAAPAEIPQPQPSDELLRMNRGN